MSREFPRRRSLDSLRKEAKRWLSALNAGATDAGARLLRAWPKAVPRPSLRDVQHALAREHGFPGWRDLKRALTPNADVSIRTLEQYDRMASALLEAYSTGTPEAMERHYGYTWHRRSWDAMRRYVLADLGRASSSPDITLEDARHLVAVEYGFQSWQELESFVRSMPGATRTTAKPMRVQSVAIPEAPRPVAVTRDWQTVLRFLEQTHAVALDAAGQMADAMLRDTSGLASIVTLNLAGSKGLTDDGLRTIATLPNLRHLDVSGTSITDDGVAILGQLPWLESVSLAMTRVTDRGVSSLTPCHRLRRLDLSHTRTGDASVRALTGKTHLAHFRSGTRLTNDGLAALHEWPVFKTWQGGAAGMALLNYDAEPNSLMLRGRLTDAGLRHLRGLTGLFALNLDDRALGITAAGLASLVALPHLGWVALDAKTDWMPYIAEMPALRFLGAQDTAADDDGFVALSRSQSIEYIWGRRCHNLRDRGFAALANMPRLRALSVSCLNVGDAALAALPSFPALRELMPMDVPDAGYRHIGKCPALESLVLMYCRDTTDAATAKITSLPHLRDYFNSYTAITDRTPALLATMDSLERITFDACHQLTDAGIAQLARLPRLKEIRVTGRGVSSRVGAPFRAGIYVDGDV
jgi:hypothetical protein